MAEGLASPRKKRRIGAGLKEADGDHLTANFSASDPTPQTTESDASMSVPSERVDKEAEVGITEFVNPTLAGFTAIFKKR